MPLPHYYFIRLTPCGGTRRQFKTDVFQYVAALDRQTSSRPAYQRLWQQILRKGGQQAVPDVLSRRVFDMMLEEKAVFFCDDILLYSNIARIYPEGYVGEFYMGNDFFINNEFTMFDWVRNAMEKSLQASTSQMSEGPSGMKLSDVGAIFYLLLIGLGAAFTVFITEVFGGFVALRSERRPRPGAV
ncbi:hypothetical protein IscW_ISCW004757 [Ixodes scapularis]|uniref:Uncharacterized protein n=1 Tax=Ixodes scapularis TaxID=6945 RepID=B7PHL6_IXOSC|nr:hypothetical protein IscW_ISCW004757 [Ixodes scapularis]|eukprot:XP_002403187.1 hypothetical protein IscW_ISCW004757 [Ixodes scapularis]